MRYCDPRGKWCQRGECSARCFLDEVRATGVAAAAPTAVPGQSEHRPPTGYVAPDVGNESDWTLLPDQLDFIEIEWTPEVPS